MHRRDASGSSGLISGGVSPPPPCRPVGHWRMWRRGWPPSRHHLRYVAQAKQKEPEIIFLGDSVVQRMEGTRFWRESFEQLHALAFGIGGDQTQHLLWRIQNGELDFCKPKMVIIHIGTNNFGHSPSQIVEGIAAVAKAVRQKQPEASVTVTTLLPRGEHPNPLRTRNLEVNAILETYNFGFKVHLEVIDAGFVHPDGSISHIDMYDYLHLTDEGYHKAFGELYEYAKNYVGVTPSYCVDNAEDTAEWEEDEDESISGGAGEDDKNNVEDVLQ
ncbi:platelet-activating factor acetylhydrolase IB subunit alpha1 isoform X2 [Bacillus rossius redtenbacheri]|uniref:platelet-activating factor acetylhydrolase IB subunit alpha1 isoform X2 n=1 Tax=Bacillus rossius redtenbacheri TaxID=93214 RepID=UPI002FDD7209